MSLAFDFSTIASQGLTITTLCINSLTELLHPPAIPSSSHYHLVTHSPSLRPSLAQVNPWEIINAYLSLNSQAICDVVLPYRDENGELYLGRYVMWRGELMGVRLCTE
jgi:hypothetical protein